MKVFISYSFKDEPLATRLVDYLERAGLDAWYDKREIMPGDNWAEKISQGLKESNAMIALLTPDALESKAFQGNISYALGEKAFSKRLIPVLVGDSETFTSERMPWILKRLEPITLSGDAHDEQDFEQIVKVLKDAA